MGLIWKRAETKRKRFWRRTACIAAAATAVLLTGIVSAVRLECGEKYHLKPGEVLEGDLTVSAKTIIIEGTINGDLTAAGQSIQIKGTVTEDVMLAAYEVSISGEVRDDARIAGMAVEITGSVGDDLYSLGGGAQFAPAGLFGATKVTPGLTIGDSATVSGDALLAAADVDVRGSVAGDLYAAGAKVLIEGTVGSNANIAGQSLQLAENAKVTGSLAYSGPAEPEIPDGTVGKFTFNKVDLSPSKPSRAASIVTWVFGAIAAGIGFILACLIVKYAAPQTVIRPASVIAASPVRAGLWGLLIVALFTFVPVASCLLVVLSAFQGIDMAVGFVMLVAGCVIAAWNLSPLITGLWVGRLAMGKTGDANVDLTTLVAGVLLVALLARLPFIGVVVSLVSMFLAIGAVCLTIRAPQAEPIGTAEGAPPEEGA